MFIKTYHPKNSILPTMDTVVKILSMGWTAQAKMNGYCAQVHVTEEGIFCFTRHGSLHAKKLPKIILNSVLQSFPVGSVFQGEWCHHEERLYVFDYIKSEGVVLNRISFSERHKLLPSTIGPLTLLPILSESESAFRILMDENTEGLVFRNPNTKGFQEGSIIKCRRNGITFEAQKMKRK